MANFWSLRVRIRSMSRVCVWLRQNIAHAFLNVSPCSPSNCNEKQKYPNTVRTLFVLFITLKRSCPCVFSFCDKRTVSLELPPMYFLPLYTPPLYDLLLDKPPQQYGKFIHQNFFHDEITLIFWRNYFWPVFL